MDKVVEEPKQRIFPKKEPRDSKIKESNFLNKLYETSNKHDEEDAHKIDFSKRRFEFQLDKYTFTPKDVVDDLEPISSFTCAEDTLPNCKLLTLLPKLIAT